MEVDILTYRKYNAVVGYERTCAYARQHQLTVTEVAVQGTEKRLSNPEQYESFFSSGRRY